MKCAKIVNMEYMFENDMSGESATAITHAAHSLTHFYHVWGEHRRHDADESP